jgi:uncharacterized Tic20 family protein
MENQPLNFEIRLKAALCHLLGFTWLPITIILFYILPINNHDLNWAFLALFTVPVLGLLLANLVVVLFWSAYRKSHPFIDRSGRCAVNLISSCSLYLTVTMVLMGLTCGLTALGEAMLPLSMMASYMTIFIEPSIFLAHFGWVIFGVIFAFQGKIVSYPLTIKFLHEN